jgi:hypothetical protein
VLKSANLQEILFNQKLQDTMDLVGVIVDKYRDFQCDLVVIDRTGVGQGVFDRLKQMDIPVKGISFGETADDNEMFGNMKAELHWKQRKWVIGGGKLLANYGWNEFEIVKYKNKDGKIVIQPKEELFREGIASPNCVDAAVLTQCVSDTTIKSTRLMKMQGGAFKDKTIEIWRG